MNKRTGLSARAKLTLSYAGFLMIAGVLLLTAVWVFLPMGSAGIEFPAPADFARVFNPGNRGPVVFLPAAILVLGFMLVFGLVGGWVLAGRMLAPLDRITEATRTAAKGSLSHRIELQGRTDEFGELADAFDSMLARLEAHVAEQRRFAANASHELRTPLAITQTLLDLARNDPDRASSELDERLRVVNARAIELTEALLLLSRADQRSFTREDVDLSLVAEEATEMLLPLAEKHDVTIETGGEVAHTIGSPALLLQLTTNLMHNAIVHNSPEGGTVAVHTTSAPGSVVLTVENTGDKLDPQLVATLTEPFQRGTQRTRTDHAGVGLGLTIVRSIAQAHDGTLSLSPRAGGGLRATVRLPGVTASPRLRREPAARRPR
ncbi:sensor histidine kinase [Amycolatopsis tucumanensis]|uniref:sensor histidine kinase n=1 Tax=Amycolatopsis tucumanensis TaxID=401106 RepID=UPI001F30AF0D|nr:HAMP domain-containing sensor histidine kinase [Amycolatopsis tucumanensis]MCF6421055.1 HAMP domain-containing histidine kinase [Amycolatopsis tucumanensis]